MSQADSLRRELSRLREQEAALQKDLSRYRGDEAKALEEAHKQMQSAERASSPSSRNSYATGADRARKKSVDAGHNVADVNKKLAQNSRQQADKIKSLQSAERIEQQSVDRDSDRRRRKEIEHARHLGQVSSPSQIRFVHVRPPEPEKLRVLYLTANPDLDLRTEAEVRQVQQAMRGAKYRDRVEIAQRPAATFQDLLDGLNDVRPHIVHFSGHSEGRELCFDQGEITESEPHSISFGLLVKALAATDQPPEMLILNSCDSLDGAAMLLPAVPVIIGMSDSVPDTAAIVFAQQFYAAIASGQSVSSALMQGKVKIEAVLLDGESDELPQSICRDDVDLNSLVLVKPDR